MLYYIWIMLSNVLNSSRSEENHTNNNLPIKYLPTDLKFSEFSFIQNKIIIII